MIIELPDVNVLVAASAPDHIHHAIAYSWLKNAPCYSTTPITESGLVRCLMNPRVVSQAVSYDIALKILDRLKSNRRAVYWADSLDIAQAPIRFTGTMGYRQVTDLRLINLADQHYGRLVTFDAKIAAALSDEDRHLIRVL